MCKKEDEYEQIYDDDDSRNYEELPIDESPEDAMERLRGTIGRGTCLYCGAKDGMEYEGHICFICKVCGKSVHEDLYYMWAAGYEIDLGE